MGKFTLAQFFFFIFVNIPQFPIAATNLDESFTNDIENKENAKPTIYQQQKKTIDASLPVAKDQVKLEVEVQKVLVSKENHTADIEDRKVVIVKSSPSLTTSSSNRRPANLLTRPKTPQLQMKSNGSAPLATGKTGKTLTKVEPPHVYDFKDIYQKKKEEKMKKLLEEEKKNRIFHSRPVPKSVAAARDQLPRKAQIDSKLTIAKTPVVLKNSREAQERRKQRVGCIYLQKVLIDAN